MACLDTLGYLVSLGREPLGRLGERLLGPPRLAVEPFDGSLEVGGQVILLVDFPPVVEHRFERAAVLALEPVELAEAVADGFQTLRVELDAGIVILQKRLHLRDDDLRRLDLFQHAPEGPVDAEGILQLVARATTSWSLTAPSEA